MTSVRITTLGVTYPKESPTLARYSAVAAGLLHTVPCLIPVGISYGPLLERDLNYGPPI